MIKERSFGFEKGAEDPFEKQFSHKEEFEIGDGVVEVVDIKPESPKSEIPVFLAPGWAMTTEVNKPTIKTLVEKRRRVVSFTHPGSGENIHLAPEAVGKYPDQELRKALNILGVLDNKHIDKTDVIAHSEAALNTVIAAMLHPEKFRNIILYNPAGLIGKDTFTRLLRGFAGQMKRPASLAAMPGQEGARGFREIPITETEKEVAALAAKEFFNYSRKHPVRGVKEAVDISKSQIHEMLRYLHEKGVGIVVMSGVDDPVFPQKRMQKIAKTDMLNGFLSVRGGHGELGTHPELYADAAEKMLTALEEKSKKVQRADRR